MFFSPDNIHLWQLKHDRRFYGYVYTTQSTCLRVRENHHLDKILKSQWWCESGWVYFQYLTKTTMF